MKTLFRIRFLLLAAALALSLSGCFDSGGSGSALSVEATGPVTSAASTITVPAGSPIAGTTVTVPAGALGDGESVTISINYTTELPLATSPSVVVSGKIIVLTKDSGSQFLVPVTVTMPYDPTTGVPSVLYFNETSKMYESIAVLSIDIAAKLITFETVHFSKYGAFSSKDPMTGTGSLEDAKIEACKVSATDPSIKNCFASATDGFFHPNFGSYTTPGGSAFGMAAYASWYFNTKISATSLSTALLYGKYREGNPASADDDVTARQLISRIYGATAKAWAQWSSASDAVLDAKWKMTQRQVAQQLISTLKITGAPQLLMLRGTQAGSTTSHAVVVYKYDGTGSPKRFYVYDPNFPGAEVTLDYDPAATDANQVLKSYSKLGATFSAITRYAFGSISSGIDPKRFEDFFNGAEAGWTGTQFASIAITAPTAVAGKYPFTTPLNTDTAFTNAQVTGTITPASGQPMPQFLVVLLDGVAATSVGTNGIVPVAANGGFSLTFASLSLGNHNLQLFATDSQSAAQRFSGFGGYSEVTLKVSTPAGTQFFQNAGFETGDMTGWDVETHTWNNRVAGSFGSHKSVIAGPAAGSDEIATATNAYNQVSPISLQKTLKGNYSLRVNNSDGSEHISTASQTVTVPASGAPEVRFYWAAVLEDPQHDPGGQPYVIITVCDLDDTASDCTTTTGTRTVTTDQGTYTYDVPNSLYFQRYFANDPNYSGWLAYQSGGWQAIDWQTVIIPVNSRPGHRIKITVEAADCAYGGHGGYVYIDGDE